MYLKQSTAATIVLGPFIDVIDGVSALSGITVEDNDVQVIKAAAISQKNSETDLTHLSGGWYSTDLNTTDTNTVGRLIVQVQNPLVHLPVWHEFYVVTTGIYNKLFGSDAQGAERLDVNVVEWVGTGVSTSGNLPNVNVETVKINDTATKAFISPSSTIPNVNVSRWANVTALASDGTFPDVNVQAIDDLVSSASNLATAASMGSNLKTDVRQWLGTDVTTSGGFPNVNVALVGLDTIPSGAIQPAAQQQLADTILSRGVAEVEASANRFSLARVILTTSSWQTIEGTGLIIRDTAGNTWDIVAISGDQNANLIVTFG